MCFVYIARCADGSLYIRHTADLTIREATHNEGSGAAYTAARRPVRIVYSEEYPDATAAIARERQLKGWTTQKKEALIRGDPQFLKGISARTRKASKR